MRRIHNFTEFVIWAIFVSILAGIPLGLAAIIHFIVKFW